MDANRHLSPETIEQFGSMPLSERRVVLSHVRTCRACGNQAATAWRLGGSITRVATEPVRFSLESVLARVSEVDSALTWERTRAPELLRELDSHPQPRRQTIVRNSRRFWLWGFAEILLARVGEVVLDDPMRALELAELAYDVTQRLTDETYGSALVADIRAKACKAVGNTRRAMSDLRGAEEALTEAQELLLAGTGDPLEKAQLDHYWGTLRNAQRRIPEAIAHFDRALGAYRRLGDKHEEARALVGKALSVSKNDPHEAIRLQRLALPLIDAEREPRLLLAAKHNLATDLISAGYAAEAQQRLEDLRGEYSRLGERVVTLRLRWLEAQVANELGEYERAELAYRDVIAGFEANEIPYESAIATLELATVYVAQGRTAEIRKIALELVPIFKALEIQPETTAALMLFRQAAEAETATLALIQHIAGFLKRAQHDPALRFSAPE